MDNTKKAVEQKRLSPQQRAMLFDQATRKYVQTLPAITFTENGTGSFTLPKSRFLSKISLLVKGTFTLDHASATTYTASGFSKYNLLKQVRVSVNNGFNPYQLSGAMLRLYNLMNNFKTLTDGVYNTLDYITNTVSSSDAANSVCFLVDLPMTVNDRDSIGLILLQNQQTQVSVDLDFGAIADIMTETDIVAGSVSITVTPIIETFSIPPVAEAIPDYSIIKVVNQQVESVTSGTEHTIKLPTGLTYRKIGLFFESTAKHAGIALSYMNTLELKMNQADVPISIPFTYLSAKNVQEFGSALPVGAYVLDFSDNGIANLGGGRDYIDSEGLSELWLRSTFNSLTGSTNSVYVVMEKLAKLS